MAWEDLPRLEISKDSRRSLREKWKWGPCYDFLDDGLGYCLICNWDHAADWRPIELKRRMVCATIERLRTSEATDLFAEPVDVFASAMWFLRWMEFKPQL